MLPEWLRQHQTLSCTHDQLWHWIHPLLMSPSTQCSESFYILLHGYAFTVIMNMWVNFKLIGCISCMMSANKLSVGFSGGRKFCIIKSIGSPFVLWNIYSNCKVLDVQWSPVVLMIPCISILTFNLHFDNLKFFFQIYKTMWLWL